MAKKEAFRKGQRFCCFCGKPGMSREHIWPGWAAPLLPDEPRATTYVRSNYTRSGYDAPPRRTHHTERQGSPNTIKIKAVCRACNNEWMSALEEQARPWLEPMAKLETIELTPAAQMTLTEYFTMKVLVSDKSIDGNEIFTSGERQAFYENRTIPTGLIVGVSRYVMEPSPEVTQYQKEYFKPPNALFNLLNMPVNFTLRFGPLMIQAALFRKVQGEFSYNRSAGTILWPPQDESVRWPPVRALTTREAYSLQHMLEFMGRTAR